MLGSHDERDKFFYSGGKTTPWTAALSAFVSFPRHALIPTPLKVVTHTHGTDRRWRKNGTIERLAASEGIVA